MQIKHCKICFQEVKENILNDLMFCRINVCEKCYEEMDPIFTKISFGKIKGTAIYEYNDKIKSLLYLLKGCGDIEIAPLFFERIQMSLSIRFKNYVVVPAPSIETEDEIRGFNHVIEIFKPLGLKIVNCIKKKENFKQSALSKEERERVKEKLSIVDLNLLMNKKVLIVDDVSTSGSTILAMIDLIKLAKPKRISVLIMAKVCRKM